MARKSNEPEIIKFRDHCELAGAAADWFHQKWKEKGLDTLFLVTDHTSFYERYGWKFLCMVQGDGEPDMSRMYVHRF